MNEDNLPAIEDDPFAEIFFSRHGVGDKPGHEQEMPEYQNVKHMFDPDEPTYREKMFCKFVCRGETQSAAYIKAFNIEEPINRDSVKSCATKLIRRPRVAAELASQRQKIQDLEFEDVSTLIDELNEDRKLARSLGQPGAAITAVKTKASLLGLDNSENNKTTVNLNLTDQQKNNLLDRIGMTLLKNSGDTIEDADYEDVTPDE